MTETPSAPPAAASPAPPAEGSNRLRQTVADMARSLGLVLGLVVVLLLIGPARTLIFPGDNRQAAVSYDAQVAAFGRLAHTAPVVPTTVPAQWRANAADIRQTKRGDIRLHIGWGVPGTRFVGLDETTGDPSRLVRDVLGKAGATVAGERQLDTQAWQLRRSARGETALTRAFGRVFVVVTGNASDAQLEQFARSLH